jgi:signal transduction histidine kinase/ActR/RegA family two-component response regulator
MVHNPAWLTRMQTAKGWLFVAASAGMLYLLINHYVSILRKEDKKLREITESLRLKQIDLDQAQAVAHTGSWRLNVMRNELFWSDEAYRIFKVDVDTSLTYDDFIGFVHPEDRSSVDNQWKAALKGKPYDIDHRIIVDGSIKWVREKAELEFDGEGNLLGGFGTVQDITDRKQLEFDLLSAIRAAEEANRIKSQFLANMSHELRTPLTGIMSSLEMMQTEVESSDRQRLLEIADESAHRLLRIISDLLDFSILENGRLKIEEQTFSLRNCINNSVEMFSTAVRKKGIEIDSTISSALPDRIIGDPHRLGQVLLNLVGNAVKFTERGKITVSVEKHGKDIVFTIADTGIGIVPANLNKLFEPFTQADGSITRRYSGTGLGLAISKELVELMGGKIWAESEFGLGSTFSFSLPLKTVQKGEEARPPGKIEGEFSPIRVLVAEDDPAIRQFLQIFLIGKGIDVALAEDGFQAVSSCQKEHFDLILMDLQMPIMDGLEATRQIRDLEDHQEEKTCIFALTAHVRPEDKEECLQVGMDGFLTKPLRSDELDTLIKNRSAPIRRCQV